MAGYLYGKLYTEEGREGVLCFFGKERRFAKRILRNIDKRNFFFAEAERESFGRMSFMMRQKQCVFGTETDTFCVV